MNDIARQSLIKLVREHGVGLGDDPRRLKAFLTDVGGNIKREVSVLVAAAECRIPADILGSSTGIPRSILARRLAARLTEERAMTDEAAVWAVESWFAALGKTAPSEQCSSGTRPKAENVGRPEPKPIRGQSPSGELLRPMKSIPDGVPKHGLRRTAGIVAAVTLILLSSIWSYTRKVTPPFGKKTPEYRKIDPFEISGRPFKKLTIESSPALTPSPEDAKTAKAAVSLLEKYHLSRPTIDDEAAKKWVQMFLKDLDPQKYYFLKADIDEYLPQASTLDEKIREGNIDFARQVFACYLKRSGERLEMVRAILKVEPDFTIDESMVADPERFDYPSDEKEAFDRMRKRIKFELLQAKVDGESEEESVKKIAIRYLDRNRMVHQFNSGDLLEFYLSSLGRIFDPHTTYMNKSSLEDLMQQSFQLSLTGIGVSLQSENGYVVVKELIAGGPAEKDGRIQVEDKILGIQKDDGTEVDFVEQRLRDVTKQTRGEANSHVKLIIQPRDTKEKKVYNLVRQKVDLSESYAKGQVIEAKADGKTVKVGVIRLPSFYGDIEAVRNGGASAVSCTNDCRKLIDGFKTVGVDTILLDLRGNGGGTFNEAISLSGLFIDKGPIGQERDNSGVTHRDDNDSGMAWDGPIVLVIDHQSASATEIFVGVIKDYGRGLIIGDASTYGKGSVQKILPVNEDGSFQTQSALGALKCTTGEFYRVNGDSIQIRGVQPDIHIPSIFDQAEFGEGKMDNALKFDHVNELPHDQFNRVPADLVARLAALSEKRRSQSGDFRKLDAGIRKFVERKGRQSFSLNETKFRAETTSEGENKDVVAKAKDGRRIDNPAWVSGYYNDEVLRIVVDYLTLGRG